MSKIAVLGLGLIGSSASRRLRDKGFDLTLWNRSFEKAEALAKELNVVAAKTIADAVESAEVAVMFLADDDAVINVALNIPRADGLIISNFSTITPRTSMQVSELLKARGVCYIETPVIGGPGAIREGKTIVLVSGPNHCIRRARDVIEALASRVFTISEDIGKAMALKLSFNTLLINTIAALAEALNLAESYDVERRLVAEVFSETMFKEVIERYYNRMVGEDIPIGFRLTLAGKDLEYALRAGYERGAPLPITATTQQLYRLAIKAGYGDEDYARIYKFFKNIGQEKA